MTNPTVSVVMTAYNGEAYIAEAIRGVLEQTFTDFELIVIDDGSSDHTVEIIKGFDDPRLVFVQNERNMGISNTRNRGAALTRGRYLAAHDQDDISYPIRLRHQVEVLDADPNVVLVTGRVDAIPRQRGPWPPLPVPSPAVLAWTLFTGSQITHSTICVRLAALRDNGLKYEQNYHYAEDFELFHRLSELGKIVMVPDTLGAYRQHDKNASLLHYKEMTANGQSFLRGRYNEYLGPDAVGSDDIVSVWKLMIEQRDALSEDELMLVGGIVSRLVDRFIARRGLEGDDARQVYAAAAGKWQLAVLKTARVHGPSMLRFSSAFANLKAVDAGLPNALLRGADATARFVYNKLRGRCG